MKPRYSHSRLWTTEAALALALSLSLLAAGCAHRAPDPSGTGLKQVAGRSCQEPEELLDVLSKFSTQVQKGDYHKAIAMLVPEDQARMMGKDGKVPEDIKTKMDALDYKALANDRRIDLIRGRLKGVYDCLPCLDQGEPVVVAKEDKATKVKPKKPAPPEEGSSQGIEKARKAMAADFYRKIQSGRWQKASGLVHPSEWELFLDEDKNLTDLSERRLQAIQECDLDALTLQNGLLTGIVLLLEPPVSDLYLKADQFFDLVEANRMKEALGMILESERKFFLDEKGKLRPDPVEKLKALDRSEWRRLYLYHDVLLGVAEAAVGYPSLSKGSVEEE